MIHNLRSNATRDTCKYELECHLSGEVSITERQSVRALSTLSMAFIISMREAERVSISTGCLMGSKSPPSEHPLCRARSIINHHPSSDHQFVKPDNQRIETWRIVCMTLSWNGHGKARTGCARVCQIFYEVANVYGMTCWGRVTLGLDPHNCGRIAAGTPTVSSTSAIAIAAPLPHYESSMAALIRHVSICGNYTNLV